MEKDSSFNFEAVKIGMAQTKDGTKLTVVLHPHEDQTAMAELFGQPIGTRYMIALVALGDDDKPIPRSVGMAAVMRAGILCRDPAFQKWLYDNGWALSASEEDASEYVHKCCEISSRAELANSAAARDKFDLMAKTFAAHSIGL